MKQYITPVALALLLAACGTPENELKTENKNTMATEIKLSHKDMGTALLASLETGDTSAVGYINPQKYVQHI